MRQIGRLPARPSKHLRGGWGLLVILAVAMVLQALGGCATWQTPQSVDDAGLRGRAITETVGDVRLSAAVLSAADGRQLFGADVNATGIQPVWVEVENPGPDTLWLLRAGTDPDYFSPLEVAWSFHAPLAGKRNAAVDKHFEALDFRNPIPPGATRSGVLFTNPHRRTRLFNVDLLGQHRMIPFTLFLPDPGNPPDEDAQKTVARYAEASHEDIKDPEALRNALRRVPCCGQGKEGVVSGDPLNVVLVGALDDIAAALVRRGFRSDRQDFDDAQRLFGRRPDFVLRKAGQGGVPANWIRGWVAPLSFRGQLIFLVQAGRPIGGRSAVANGGRLVVHPDVDEARNLLIQDLLYSGGLAKLGFVDGVVEASVAQPRQSLAGSMYHTDGLRAVMFFVTRPCALSDVEILDWVPALELREADAAAEQAKASQ